VHILTFIWPDFTVLVTEVNPLPDIAKWSTVTCSVLVLKHTQFTLLFSYPCSAQNTISPHRNPVGRPRLIRPSPQPSTSTYHQTSVASEPPLRRARRSEPTSLPVGVCIFTFLCLLGYLGNLVFCMCCVRSVGIDRSKTCSSWRKVCFETESVFPFLMCDIPCTFVYDCNNFTNTCTIVQLLVKLLQSVFPCSNLKFEPAHNRSGAVFLIVLQVVIHYWSCNS
jgi:hypothetical protein